MVLLVEEDKKKSISFFSFGIESGKKHNGMMAAVAAVTRTQITSVLKALDHSILGQLCDFLRGGFISESRLTFALNVPEVDNVYSVS
jgi:hypothetical protein